MVPVTSDVPADPAPARGPGSLVIAAIGLLLVLAIVSFPIHIGPGSDHGRHSCGNALHMDVSRWQNGPDGPYRDIAHRVCTEARVTRVTWAVVVASTTLLVSLVALRRHGATGGRRSRPNPWRIGPPPPGEDSGTTRVE
jgi:hypothetical protein